MTTDARMLAAELAARSDAELAELFHARGVPPGIGWNDFFDAAEALLDPSAISRCVTTLPRDLVAALATGHEMGTVPGGEAREALAALVLIDAEGRPLPGADLMGAELPGPDTSSARAGDAPGIRTPADDDAVPAPAADPARAAERAFTTIAALGELVLDGLHAPLARVGSGQLSASERKRLVETEIAASATDVDHLVTLAEDAGLLHPEARAWLVTPAGLEWLRAPSAQRWSTMVAGFRAALPPALRTAQGGWLAPNAWPGAYPLDPEWPARAEALQRRARLLGLIADDGGEPPWATAAREGGEPDAASLADLLPYEVDRVYLQNDLTAIAPGPLAPRLDVRLRTMAVRESHAQASTYRFTAASITAALTEGETADSMRAFLAELSLTGVPQPLEYLIQREAERHGLIRVGADAASDLTLVMSDDAALLETLAVDQALRPLALTREDDHAGALTSRVSRDGVYWALTDARYPVVAVDRAGNPEAVHRHRLAAPASAASADPHAPLIARLRETHGPDSDAAWLARELEAAVRERALLDVEVALPDGTTRTLTLEVTGIGGGRLRGRDRAADVERTLPVASILRAARA